MSELAATVAIAGNRRRWAVLGMVVALLVGRLIERHGRGGARAQRGGGHGRSGR